MLKLCLMQEKKLRVYNKVLNKIRQSKKILIMSHRNPDWDTIGAWIWLYEMIKTNFWLKKIDLFCLDTPWKNFVYLDNINLYKSSVNLNNYDLVFSLDSSSIKQLWINDNLKNYNSISIDHHPTNEIFCRQNVVIPEYSSTSEILYEMFYLNWYEINSNSANAFLTWIITDTWWFKHSNLTQQTLKYSKNLINNWANREFIIENFFKNNSLNQIKLWWKIIWNSFINSEWILFSSYKESDITFYNLQKSDTKGIIDYLNSVNWIKYSTLLEIWKTWVKWSLRTLRDDINLYEIASKLGWGWHKKASWFNFDWWVVVKSDFYLNKINNGKN